MDMVLGAEKRRRVEEGTLVERVKRYIQKNAELSAPSIIAMYDGTYILDKDQK